MAPPVILIPATSSEFSRTLQGGESRHFISEREFAAWAKSHPSIRPSTSAGGTGSSGESTPKGYQAPQHPASHVFKTIPPRAPVRSTRSNILSYTLHLAMTSRLSAFHAPNGTAELLQRAENGDAPDAGQLARLEEEDKAAGLWKLANSLYRESQRSGELPNSVKRRVALTALVEDLLANPPNVGQSPPINVKESSALTGIDRLVPLTTPNTTTLYSVVAPPSKDGSGSSIAQTLIDMKFGGKEEEMPASPVDKPSSGPVASTSRLTAEPHMDYRIKRGQAMRSRAKEIFSTSILPSSSTAWCRRHRVAACVVCKATSSLPPVNLRARTIPGQGLEGTRDTSELIVNLIPSFLDLSANLLRDLRERAAAYENESLEYTVAVVADAEIQVTSAWYSLLTSFLVQACLQGYLVDGWTGTTAIETLLGVGCGVWEGRGWSARIPPPRSNASMSTDASRKRKSVDWSMETDDTDSESDDDEETILEVQRERERDGLLEAAQTLFGSRDVAQADYEKTMRDLIHEFLDIAEGSTLTAHLSKLNAKYPLSTFENEMVDFVEATAKLLGKPALAKYESSSPTASPALSRGDPDPFALTRYFCRPEIAEAVAAQAAVDQRDTKRRKIAS